MKITFLGATRTVTGSNYLVEGAGKEFLVDCGMWQGSSELEEENAQDFEFNPKEIDFTPLEESASACPYWRRGLTPLGRLQKYPKIHVSTGEESSGSGPEFTQGLRPRHQRERNSERPPRNSHGDWPLADLR